MTTLSLEHNKRYWEQRIAKENLAASLQRGLPFAGNLASQGRLQDCLSDRSLLKEPIRRNWPVHLTKSRSGLAWQEYSQARNPIAGYNTRWRSGEDIPFHPHRSSSVTTDAFPTAPRMQCALRRVEPVVHRGGAPCGGAVGCD